MDNLDQRELLQDLVNNPRQFGLTDDEVEKSEMSTVAACEDLFNIYIEVEKNKVVKAVFNGEGCAISFGATEAILRTIEGKTIKEVENILNNYELFINGKLESTNISELDVFEIVNSHVSRRKCAMAPIETIRKVIK